MKTNLIILLFLLSSTTVFSCDCIWGGSFLHSISESDIVIKGTVKGYDMYRKYGDSLYPTVLIVEVDSLIAKKKGAFSPVDFYLKAHEFRIVVFSWKSCSPYVDGFEIGTQWIFKFTKAKFNYMDVKFVLGYCATNYLEVENQIVKGNIDGENQHNYYESVYQEMKLSDFISKIQGTNF